MTYLGVLLDVSVKVGTMATRRMRNNDDKEFLNVSAVTVIRQGTLGTLGTLETLGTLGTLGTVELAVTNEMGMNEVWVTLIFILATFSKNIRNISGIYLKKDSYPTKLFGILGSC